MSITHRFSTLCKVGATHEAPALYGLEDAGDNVAEFDFKTRDILVTLCRLSSAAQGGGALRLHNALHLGVTAKLKLDSPSGALLYPRFIVGNYSSFTA